MSSTAGAPSSGTVVAQARARGAYAHVVDAAAASEKLAALDGIAAAMSFPESFGRNLDALYDCLTDLSWLPMGEHVLVWVGPAALKGADPKAYLAIHGVLFDAQRALGPDGDRAEDRRLTVVLTDE
jgi:RNAse (barnase) inhibitor barstar